MQFRILLLLTGSALCISSEACAQTASQLSLEKNSQLEAIADATVKKFNVPGICIAIVDGDRRIRIAAGGVRKSGESAEITINDRFHLGSCTKAMTATVAAYVVRDTKLEWDSTIAETLPEIAKTCHEDFKNVTLRQLLVR